MRSLTPVLLSSALLAIPSGCGQVNKEENKYMEDPIDRIDADDVEDVVEDYEFRYINHYEGWDADDDGRITLDEFSTGFSGVGWFAAWDRDGDRRLGFTEFHDGVLDRWDDDHDGKLSPWEVKGHVTFWLGDLKMDKVAFSAWDADANGFIDASELGVALREHFQRYDGDADGAITAEELDLALFRAWDDDADGYVDVYEARWY